MAGTRGRKLEAGLLAHPHSIASNQETPSGPKKYGRNDGGTLLSIHLTILAN